MYSKEQNEAIHQRDDIHFEEFNLLFDTLMIRTWEVDGYTYNLANLDWNWGYNTNVTRLGVCRGKQKSIEISKALLMENLSTGAKEFEDTIRHEIAHAIDVEINGHSSHGRKWKLICLQVGAKPIRCSKQINSPEGKYTVKCDNCNHTSQAYRKRRGKAACSKCCNQYNRGRYSEKYILRFIPN